jgi:two-component system cell cycle response regulator DivK
MAKLLIIDDTENNRILLGRRFKPRGHEILFAEDAEKGLELAREQRPQLILMDVGLPGMDGWQATRTLKSDPATQGIFIIALTAHAMSGDRDKALAAGCDGYESKPIDFTALFSKVDELLARHSGAGAAVSNL